MSKFKILFLIGGFGTGGKERQLAELIKGLDRSKYEVFLMIRSEGAHYLSEINTSNTKIFNLNRTRFGWDAIFEIKKIIKDTKPNIVHSWASTTSVYALLIKWLLGFKFVFIDGSIRQANPRCSQKTSERLIRYFINLLSDYIISNSHAGHKAYRTNPKKAKVVYNGFNFQRNLGLIPKKEIVKKYGIKSSFVIGMVARFDPQKDWEQFISSAIRFCSTEPDVTFLCVGDGPLLEISKSKVTEEFKDRIIFTGKSDIVESLVNVFDIAVLLSNNLLHGEGISNSITEYMSLGKAVIVNDNGGNSELVHSPEVGFLIKDINDEILAELFELLKVNTELRISMGHNAERRIKEIFSYEKMITSYDDFYQSVFQ